MTATPGQERDAKIRELLLLGNSVDTLAEHGPRRGWTREDVLRVASDSGWTLDGSGRIPRDQRKPALAAVPNRPADGPDDVKARIAAGLKSEHKPIARAAAKANQALADLDTLTAEWDAKKAARDKVAELEEALRQARAAMRGTTPTAPRSPAATGEHSQARAWARQHGIDVPAKGRVPDFVMEQWRNTTTESGGDAA